MSTQSHNHPQRRPNFIALGIVLGAGLGVAFESSAVLLTAIFIGILLDWLQRTRFS